MENGVGLLENRVGLMENRVSDGERGGELGGVQGEW